MKRGLFPQNDGTFLAMTGCESKYLKTEKGAIKWLARRGLDADGRSI